MRIPIAAYARKDVALATVVCGALAVVGGWIAGAQAWGAVLALLAIVVWLLVLAFFRDPERTAPPGDRLVLAPADGAVTALGAVHEPEFLGGPAVRLGIALSPLGVRVNRAPIDCEVVQVDHRRRAARTAHDAEAAAENESAALRVRVLGGRVPMIVRQVTGALARRIVCPVEPGTRLAAGERYGMIELGSRAEVWLRADQPVTWRVQVGDTVRGGQTVLGELGSANDDGEPEED